MGVKQQRDCEERGCKDRHLELGMIEGGELRRSLGQK